MGLMIAGPGVLVFGVYSVVAALFPGSVLEQWLRLHIFAVAFGAFLLLLSVMVIAYLRDDGMVE